MKEKKVLLLVDQIRKKAHLHLLQLFNQLKLLQDLGKKKEYKLRIYLVWNNNQLKEEKLNKKRERLHLVD